MADALRNETIVKLRGQYVDMAAKEAIWAAKYGHDHLAAVNLRRQMDEIKRNMIDELKRIQESYKSDYDIAVTREESIKASLATVVSGLSSPIRRRFGYASSTAMRSRIRRCTTISCSATWNRSSSNRSPSVKRA